MELILLHFPSNHNILIQLFELVKKVKFVLLVDKYTMIYIVLEYILLSRFCKRTIKERSYCIVSWKHLCSIYCSIILPGEF